MVAIDEVVQAARSVGEVTGIAPAVLLAVATVETNAIAYALFSGRREPLIRFEGHYFDRLLAPAKRQEARLAGLADPKPGGVRNPAAQSARWRLLDRAAAIDPAAAYEATSWGLGQVMGAHWKVLGFDDPQSLAEEARRSAAGQFMLVAHFLSNEGIDRLLPGRAFAAFARRYNGPAFARNGYDAKIAKAYAAAERQLASAPPFSAIGPGARGETVKELQRGLGRHGFAIVADGVFGSKTATALSAFRASKGLSASPLADPRTLDLLAG